MLSSSERFSNRVENYVKYRPNYPREMLDLFRDKMNLQTTSIIADIGSGTGISSKLFLENGNPVFGIEPNAAMREASEIYLQDFPTFRAINGTAENTTLDKNSIDIIIVAQAFHWFNPIKTPLEFKRILRTNGYVAMIWNERQLDSNEFLRDYEKLLLKFGNDYQEVRHDKISKELLADFFQINFREAMFTNAQVLDFRGLKGRVLSSSYMPAEDHPRFGEMEKALHSLFTHYKKNDIIEIRYDTKLFFGQF